MKKWYQPCGWMLLTALALNLSGCAQGSAYMSRFSLKKDKDRKLVNVDGKKKPKSTAASKKSTATKDKTTESQLAKKTPAKPKVQSGDDSSKQLASSKDAPKKDALAEKARTSKAAPESSDPFLSPELAALAAKNRSAAKNENETATPADSSKDSNHPAWAGEPDEAVETAQASPRGPLKPDVRSQTTVDGSSRIQEVAHKVEDNPADNADLPEWAMDPATAAALKNRRQSTRVGKADATNTARQVAATQESTRQESPHEEVEESASKASRSATKDVTDSVSLISLCPDASGELSELIRGMDSSDVEGLKRGVHRIGRMGPEAGAAAPALVHLLHHKNGFVRIHSALALARMQQSPPEAVLTVVDGLKSTDPGVRSFSAAVLAEMGPQASDALTTLAESLKDRDGYVRLHAAEVLIRYDRWSYEALETLLSGLKDKDENIRWLATYSLAELAPESPETVEALINATRDPVLKVQVGAVYALGEIGPFARRAGAELRKIADSTSQQELQSAILSALQQIEQ